MAGVRWRTTAATAPALAARVSVLSAMSATRTRSARARGRCRRTAAVSRDSARMRVCQDAMVASLARTRARGCGEFGLAIGWRPPRQSRGVKSEVTRLNIILVTGATARARTITLDWRHWALGSLSMLTLFLVFTFMFNFVTLKWAAA